MSWICKNCETENADILDVCEVCETHAPIIVDFEYDKLLSDKPITIRWKAEYCDSVSIFYKGETIDVSGKEAYSINNPDEPNISFILSNSDTTTRMICYTMDFIKCPSIAIKSDKLKLRKRNGEFVKLSWTIENSEKAFLIDGDNKTEIPFTGETSVCPITTTVYTIEALALDGETTFNKELQIGVFDECSIEFKADKHYIYPTVPITLSWNVTNAKSVMLNSEPVEVSGTKIIEPEKATTYVLSAEDEFGIKEKKIDIQMLPLPQVKSLLVPTPNITSNLSVHIKQPKYQVDVRFPTINIDWIKVETPKVPSFTDLGLKVELSLPKTTHTSIIKRVYKLIENKINKKLLEYEQE